MEKIKVVSKKVLLKKYAVEVDDLLQKLLLEEENSLYWYEFMKKDLRLYSNLFLFTKQTKAMKLIEKKCKELNKNDNVNLSVLGFISYLIPYFSAGNKNDAARKNKLQKLITLKNKLKKDAVEVDNLLQKLMLKKMLKEEKLIRSNFEKLIKDSVCEIFGDNNIDISDLPGKYHLACFNKFRTSYLLKSDSNENIIKKIESYLMANKTKIVLEMKENQ